MHVWGRPSLFAEKWKRMRPQCSQLPDGISGCVFIVEHSIGAAKSADGLKWERVNDKPVFEASEVSDWANSVALGLFLVGVDPDV